MSRVNKVFYPRFDNGQLYNTNTRLPVNNISNTYYTINIYTTKPNTDHVTPRAYRVAQYQLLTTSNIEEFITLTVKPSM